MADTQKIQRSSTPSSKPVEDWENLDLEKTEDDSDTLDLKSDMEDRYVDDTSEEKGTPLNVEALTLELKTLSLDIRTNSKYTPEERKTLLGKIGDLLGKLKTFKDGAPVPQNIAHEVSVFEAEVVGKDAAATVGTEGEEGASTQKQIDELKQKIQGSKVPPEQQKALLAKIDGQKDLGEQGDLEGVAGEAQELIGMYEKHSSTAIRLAQQINAGSPDEVAPAGQNEAAENLPSPQTVENLEAMAKKHNIDLNNPPAPPNKNMIEFLQEASPNLMEKMKAVKEAADSRMQEDQKDANDCKAINATRSASTTGPVEEGQQDTKMFQNRYDRKYYQDKTSRALVETMESANQEVRNLLGAIYPNVQKVEPAKAEGWQNAYNRAMMADKISVGGAVLDLFNNTDGSLNVSFIADKENIVVDTIEYDDEGDGKWKPGVNGYGDDVNLHDYDGGDTTVVKGMAYTAGGAAAGAAIGAAIYPGVGTAIGAGAGAIIGFVGSIF